MRANNRYISSAPREEEQAKNKRTSSYNNADVVFASTGPFSIVGICTPFNLGSKTEASCQAFARRASMSDVRERSKRKETYSRLRPPYSPRRHEPSFLARRVGLEFGLLALVEGFGTELGFDEHEEACSGVSERVKCC